MGVIIFVCVSMKLVLVCFLYFAFALSQECTLPSDCDVLGGEVCFDGFCCSPALSCDEGPYCGDFANCGVALDCPECIENFECVDNLCCYSECDPRRCGTFTLCGEAVNCGCAELEVCNNGFCEDVTCTDATHCGTNEVCVQNTCTCDQGFVPSETGSCIVDPCDSCTGTNTVCDTGVQCFCKPGFGPSNGNDNCIQNTEEDGDQTKDLHFRQTLPLDADDETVPLDFVENIDGSLTLSDPEHRDHMLQWIATAGNPVSGDYTVRVTVNAGPGNFGIFAGVGQDTDPNDGYGVIFSDLGGSPRAAICVFHFGEQLCSASTSYPFPTNQDVDLEMTIDRDGGDIKFSARIIGSPYLRSEHQASIFPDTGVVGFYFEPTTTTNTAIKEASLVYGNGAVVVDLYSCLSDTQFADLYNDLTGLTNTPARTLGNNGRCYVPQQA